MVLELMKKKAIVFTTLIVLSAALAPILHNLIRYKMNPIAALDATLTNSTTWAPGYSETAFRSIKLGVSSEQVTSALGPALYTNYYEGKPIWHYTVGPNGHPQSSSDGSTHVRGICFDHDMTVYKKLYYFNYD